MFYTGPVGAAIARGVQAKGGILTKEDLAAHHGEWTEPYSTNYHGTTVHALGANTAQCGLETSGQAGKNAFDHGHKCGGVNACQRVRQPGH